MTNVCLIFQIEHLHTYFHSGNLANQLGNLNSLWCANYCGCASARPPGLNCSANLEPFEALLERAVYGWWWPPELCTLECLPSQLSNREQGSYKGRQSMRIYWIVGLPVLAPGCQPASWLITIPLLLAFVECLLRSVSAIQKRPFRRLCWRVIKGNYSNWYNAVGNIWRIHIFGRCAPLWSALEKDKANILFTWPSMPSRKVYDKGDGGKEKRGKMR